MSAVNVSVVMSKTSMEGEALSNGKIQARSIPTLVARVWVAMESVVGRVDQLSPRISYLNIVSLKSKLLALSLIHI